MLHYPGHLVVGVAVFAAALAIRSVTVNRLIKRKLRLSLVLLAGYICLNLFLALDAHLSADTEAQLRSIENLVLAAAIINALVFTVVNPLRVDRVPDGFPTILQDAIVIGLVLLTASFLSTQLLTTSAVSAVVLGFALQDTLGNAFAGLAIQSERPFQVGHWVRVGDHEGRVAEITWRATKLRTKSGNFVVVPNNIVSKEPIINYSEPAPSMRLEVEVGATYNAAPNRVKAAMLDAVRHCSGVLQAPEPDVLLRAFDASSITYVARFWIDDYAMDERTRDRVRSAIYYSFQRHAIEIPWPIQVEYKREWPKDDRASAVQEAERLLAGVEMFRSLPHDICKDIAAAATPGVYGNGEAIVRQGEPGQSMFIIQSGDVSVVVEPSRQEVARIGAGGVFGEMSLLTGEPRTATVLALGDVTVLELNADVFRRLAAAHPAAVEQMGVTALTRRADLDKVKAASTGVAAIEATTLLARMKRFLRLSA